MQKRISKQGKNEYITYVITIPKIIVEAIPKIKKTEKFELSLEKERIVLSPKLK